MTVALVGFVAALVGAIALGRPILAWLQVSGVRQNISSDAPERHSTKQGTPTMGGAIMLAGVAVGLGSAWMWTGVTLASVLAGGLIIGNAAIGALDDRLSLKRGSNLGLRARDKFALQMTLTAAFLAVLAWTSSDCDVTSVLGADLGSLYWPLAAVFIVGLSSGTNLADGLDGLTAGMSVATYAGLAIMLHIAGAEQSLVALAATMAGACAGLLWFGAYPALVFMGDTGSLALGAGLAGIAVVGKVEAPLTVATALFWVEALSVMAQVAVFKWRKRTRGIEYARAHRLFRRAPLHHHFEELGAMPETRIVARFWVVTAATTALAVALCRHLAG